MRLGCFLLAAQHPGMSQADALATALDAAVAAERTRPSRRPRPAALDTIARLGAEVRPRLSGR